MINRYFIAPLILSGILVINTSAALKQEVNGPDLYKKHCQSCHMKKGKGFFSNYPPLTDTLWLDDDKALVGYVLNGLSGEIEVGGKNFDNEMPAFSYLTDAEIAAIINLVRIEYAAMELSLTAEQVSQYRSE